MEFRPGTAEDLSFIETGSVDLVLVGTAIHWFDQESFFVEAKRILKPNTGNISDLSKTTGEKSNFHNTLPL